MESKPLTFEDIRDFMLRERAKPSRGPLNCVVMNSLCYGRVRDAFSPEIHPAYGDYELGDRVMGLPIYFDETYPEPIFRNRAEYLAEKSARD